MATTFNVIFLGTVADLDLIEGDNTSDNASAILGSTFGSAGSPLHENIQSFSPGTNGAGGSYYDVNNNSQSDDFRINGGADQVVDAYVVYDATLTYEDGTSTTVEIRTIQDTDGNLYMVPYLDGDPEQDTLEAAPIKSITMNSIANQNSKMFHDRAEGDYFSPDGNVDGTSGSDSIGAGFIDEDYDLIDGYDGDDDVVIAGAGNDTVDGGHGSDTIDGGADNDVIRGGVGGDSIQGGSGDDQISGDFAGSEPVGFDFYYVSSAYIQGENFSIPDGEDLSYGVEDLSITGDSTVVRFTDNDSVIDGDDANNEQADDTNQTVEIDGVEYNYAVDFSLDYTDGSNTYTFAILDVDLNNDGLLNQSADGGNGKIIIQTGGPVIPAGTDLVYVPGSLTNISTLDYSTFGDISAHNFDDTIDGGDGHDTIDGGLGNDLIDGGTGNDSIDGGAGDDTLFSGDGADTVHGGDGNDSIGGFSGTDNGDDLIYGDAGNDTIIGGAGDDTIYGGTGNDVLVGHLGTDYLYGGDDYDDFAITDDHETVNVWGGEGGGDFDEIWFSNYTSTQGVSVTFSASETGTFDFIGTAGTGTFAEIEGINGTGYADIFDATADTSGVVLSGAAGADTITGGTGADSLDGGDDADTFKVNDGFGSDTIVGGEGGTDSDTLDLTALTGPVTVTYTGDEAGMVTDGTDTITFSEIENIFLTDGNDVVDATNDSVGINIFAEDGADSVLGGSGNDSIDGGAGNDTLDGGGGNDSVTGGTGNDLLYGWYGNDTIEGGDGDDTIQGNWGDDSMSGGDGADVFEISSFADSDTIVGGEGGTDFDTMSYVGSDGVNVTFSGDEAGSYSFSVGGADGVFSQIEAVSGTSGDDTLDGSATTAGVELSGEDGNDSISGGSGADSLSGGDGNDTFIGSAGADTIDGGGWWDELSYANSDAGVNVDISDGLTESGGHAEGDVLSNIQAIDGSGFDDTIVGDGNANVLDGLDGNDSLGRGGATIPL